MPSTITTISAPAGKTAGAGPQSSFCSTAFAETVGDEGSVSAFPVGSVLHVQVQRMLQGENGLGAYECRIVDSAGGAEWASATITVFQPDNVEEFLQRSSE